MLSWRAGVVFKPRPQGSLYAAYGTSFNPSAEGNTGLSLTSATVLLEPEKSRSARGRRQVGAARSSRARDRRRCSGPRRPTRARPASIPAIRRPCSRAGSEVRGFEVGFNGRLTDALDGVRRLHLPRQRGARVEHAGRGGQGARQHARALVQPVDDLPVPQRASRSAAARSSSATAGTARPTCGWRRATGSSTPSPPTRSTSGSRCASTRSNLTDERYIDRVGGGHFVPGAGRSASLSTDFRF